jgi:hypothetical protein
MSGSITTIHPGAGSFTDPSGNVFSIGNNNTAEINGQPVTPNGESSNTGALELNSGNVYGQDHNTGQWYLLASKGAPGLWEWQPVSAPPSTAEGFSQNIVPSDAISAALGNNTMGFVGGGGTDVPPASTSSPMDLSSTDNSQAPSGLTPGDFHHAKSGSLSAEKPPQGPLSSHDETKGTMHACGTWHSTPSHDVAAVPTS